MAVAKIILVQNGKTAEIDLIECTYSGTMSLLEVAQLIGPFLRKFLASQSEYRKTPQ